MNHSSGIRVWYSCCFFGCLVAIACFGANGAALAQVRALDETAISVERLGLPTGPGAFVGAQDAQLLPQGGWHFSALSSLMARPIVFRDLRSGQEASVPVRLRLAHEIALAYGYSDRLQLGLALPVVAAQEGQRLRGIGLSEDPLAAIALADIRLHAKLRMQPGLYDALGYGVAMSLSLPTGNEEHFAGEAGAVLSWSLISSYQGGGWRVAANFGLRLRTQEVVLLSPARPHGNELLGMLAAEFALPAAWQVPMGVLAEWSLVRGDQNGASPKELRAGIVAHLLANLRLKAIAGVGYTPDEVGAPAWRVALLFERDSQ